MHEPVDKLLMVLRQGCRRGGAVALAVLFCILVSAGALAAAESDGGRLTIDDADRLVYQRDQSITATGRPHLTYQYFQLDADRVVYDLTNGVMTADGNVVMADTGMVTYGDRLVYDTRREQGTIGQAHMTSPPWYFRAREIERDADREYHARRVVMTTCSDTADPHFNITATSATLYPSTRLNVYNMIFWAGPVPIFYLPFYTRVLRDPFARWHIRPGYNKREGTFLKVGYDYYGYFPDIDGTLYADYYQRRGLGLGLDLDWTPAGGKHYLYFYHIAEKSIFQDTQTGKYYNPDLPRNDNWKLYYDGRQAFAGEHDFIGRFSYLKQNDFNNDYNEGLTNRVERVLESYASLTRTRDDYTLRLSGEKDYNWNDSEARFRMTYEELPRLRFHWNTHSAGLDRWYYQFDGSLTRQRSAADDYERYNGEGEFRVLRNIPVTRAATLTLHTGLNELWENRRSQADNKDRATARLLAGADYNHLLPYDLTLRLGYEFRRRLNNRAGLDFGGQERSLATAGLHGLISPTLRWHVTEGFDCRGETAAYNYRQRWQPLRAGAFWQPRAGLDLSLETFYDWPTNRWNRIASENSWTRDEHLSVFGNAYHIGMPAGMDDVTDLVAGTNWQWGGTDYFWRLSASATWNVQANHFKETRITLLRRLHCWEAQLVLADRSNGDREVWLMFNIAAYPERQMGIYRNVDASRMNVLSTAALE